MFAKSGFQRRLSAPRAKIFHHPPNAPGGAHSWIMARDDDNNSRIAEILGDLNVTFAREVSIPGLCGFRSQRGKLRFDFYVPPKATQPEMFIEYDGIQHFGTGFGRLPGYANKLGHEYYNKVQVLNDGRKTMYCHQAGIPLLRIPPGLPVDVERDMIKSFMEYLQRVRERCAMGAEDTWSHQRYNTARKYDTLEQKLADPATKEAQCLKRARTEFEKHQIPTGAPVVEVRAREQVSEEDVIYLDWPEKVTTDLESATDLESVE